MRLCSRGPTSGGQPQVIRALWLVVVCAGTGCALGGENCTADYRYGLTVVVLDSVTGASATDSAVVTAQDGMYIDTLALSFDSLAFVGAGERSGRYAITVVKPGYRDWVRTGVRVGEDGCHVRGVSVEARLQR